MSTKGCFLIEVLSSNWFFGRATNLLSALLLFLFVLFVWSTSKINYMTLWSCTYIDLLQGFWRGNVPALLMVMPYTSIQFTVLHKFKTYMSGSSKAGLFASSHIWRLFFSIGTLAEVFQWYATVEEGFKFGRLQGN